MAELPSGLDTLRGEHREDQFWGQGSSSTTRTSSTSVSWGGGGYGDPIDRNPVLVAEDVARGLVTEGPAREIYGVVVEDGAVDEQATAARRREVRAERLGARAGRPRHAARGRADGDADCRVPAANRGRRDAVHLRAVRRSRPAGRDWKDDAALRRLPAERAGPLRTASGEFFLIEAYCPTCGTLLDTDLAAEDDPPLHDRIAHWPA